MTLCSTSDDYCLFQLTCLDPPKKRPKRINVTLPSHKPFVWESPYNMGEKITVSLTNEVGDGASSRVYVGTMNCREIAVKKLKGYSHSQANSFVKSYKNF